MSDLPPWKRPEWALRMTASGIETRAFKLSKTTVTDRAKASRYIREMRRDLEKLIGQAQALRPAHPSADGSDGSRG